MKGYVVVKRDSDEIIKGTGRYYVCRVTATEVVE